MNMLLQQAIGLLIAFALVLFGLNVAAKLGYLEARIESGCKP